MNAEERRHQIKYFINKFEAIPDDQWCTRNYHQLTGGVAQHCALGHAGFNTKVEEVDQYDPELRALGLIFSPTEFFYDGLADVADANDGVSEYAGATPKERILNALRAMLKL